MVWPCLKVFWFNKDNPTGHSERKKKRQTEEGGEAISKSGQKWTAISTRAAEYRTRWKGIVAGSFLVHRRPPKVMV